MVTAVMVVVVVVVAAVAVAVVAAAVTAPEENETQRRGHIADQKEIDRTNKSQEETREPRGVGVARKLCPLHEHGRGLIPCWKGRLELHGGGCFGGEEREEWGFLQSPFLPLALCLPSFVSHSLWLMYPSMRGAP